MDTKKVNYKKYSQNGPAHNKANGKGRKRFTQSIKNELGIVVKTITHTNYTHTKRLNHILSTL